MACGAASYLSPACLKGVYACLRRAMERSEFARSSRKFRARGPLRVSELRGAFALSESALVERLPLPASGEREQKDPEHALRTATTITASLHQLILRQKQPKVDKTPDGHIMTSSVIVVIREISKSAGIAPDFQNSLLFSLFSGNFGTASLRMIGGEGVCVALR